MNHSTLCIIIPNLTTFWINCILNISWHSNTIFQTWSSSWYITNFLQIKNNLDIKKNNQFYLLLVKRKDLNLSIEQEENLWIFDIFENDKLGDIMNLSVLKQVFPVPSWLAPKLWPISWAIVFKEINYKLNF